MASTHRRGLPLGTVMGDLCKRFLKRRHRLSLGDAMWNTQAKPSQPSLVVTNLETRLKKNKPRQPTCLPKVASIVRVHPAATQPNQILPASPPFHAVRSSFKDLSPRLDLRLLYYNTNTMKSGGLQDNFSCHGKSWNTAMALLSHHGVSKSISEETRSSIIARQDIFLLKVSETYSQNKGEGGACNQETGSGEVCCWTEDADQDNLDVDNQMHNQVALVGERSFLENCRHKREADFEISHDSYPYSPLLVVTGLCAQ